eukprot:6128902-Prymnesium_polylepis.1
MPIGRARPVPTAMKRKNSPCRVNTEMRRLSSPSPTKSSFPQTARHNGLESWPGPGPSSAKRPVGSNVAALNVKMHESSVPCNPSS